MEYNKLIDMFQHIGISFIVLLEQKCHSLKYNKL